MFNYGHTTTTLENKVLKKGKKALYLVLKKKSFPDTIIDSLEVEIEQRFNNFLKKIAPKLNNIQLENEEDGLKYLLIKGLINILNEMLQERKITLSENDKKITNEIFEEEGFEKMKQEPKAQSIYQNQPQYFNGNIQRYNSYGNNKLDQHKTKYSTSSEKVKVPINYYGVNPYNKNEFYGKEVKNQVPDYRRYY